MKHSTKHYIAITFNTFLSKLECLYLTNVHLLYKSNVFISKLNSLSIYKLILRRPQDTIVILIISFEINYIC